MMTGKSWKMALVGNKIMIDQSHNEEKFKCYNCGMREHGRKDCQYNKKNANKPHEAINKFSMMYHRCLR